MFRAVHWAARRGLREAESFSSDAKKREARRTGVRGETYAYWYLRRHGYIFVARNYTPRGIKGELDLVGYDGKTLAFVVIRTPQRFLAERHIGDGPLRFDVLAIDNQPGHCPAVRLHKDAFSPQL